MKIIFSRKGFDSVAGGGASPIIGGRPLSLPIPAFGGKSRTRYAALGLGDHVAAASRGRYGGDDLCHHDPMFLTDGSAMLGQCGAAEGHLRRQGVGPGDVFLFFGLFAEEATGERHHRIFGYLKVEERVFLPDRASGHPVMRRALDEGHPHLIALHGTNDTLYFGRGRAAALALPELRLTVPGGPVALWHRPPGVERGNLTHFPDSDVNWPEPDLLFRQGNGQEFVTDARVGGATCRWLARTLKAIERGGDGSESD